MRPMATPATGVVRGTPASSIAKQQPHTVAILFCGQQNEHRQTIATKTQHQVP